MASRAARVTITLMLLAGCAPDAPATAADAPFVVYAAASIIRPMRAALDSFALSSGARYSLESGASLELVRRVTDLQGQPDVIALADAELFPTLLEPGVTTWHAVYARNRIVLAYTTRSRHAAAISPANWWEVLERPDVQVGRADPATDPSGYRTLLVWQLAARHYHMPDLAARMLRAAPARNVRPREADQIALLQAGELDYIWTYENLATLAGLPFVKLPDAVDLGSPTDSAAYAFARVRVPAVRATDSITVQGRPILFGIAVPTRAPHARTGYNFVAYLLSPTGRRILRQAHLDALDAPAIVGEHVPTLVREAAAAKPKP